MCRKKRMTMRPLELTITRSEYGGTYTMGKMRVDGMLFGDSIEPKSRHLSSDMPLDQIKEGKVYGKTAIPTGRYRLEWRVSPTLKDRPYAKKYDGKFPYLVAVPAWTDVMIHPFNYGPESRGCIAVGERRSPGVLAHATRGYEDLMDYYLVPAFHRGQEVYVTVEEL